MLPILPPFVQYHDLEGHPLESGYLYFGAVNLNPETNPTTVYWDEAGAIPAAQPVRTINGYPVRSGSPATIYVAGDHSTTVKDSLLRLVSYQSVSLDLQRQTSSSLSSLTYENTDYAACVSRALQSRLEDRTSLKDFGAVGDGVTDDTAAIQAALSSGARLLDGDGLTYKVTSTLTGESNQHLRNMVFDASGLGAASFALVYSGTSGPGIVLTVDAVLNTFSVTMASTAGLASGQWCFVSSGDFWSPAALDSVTRGEYVRIKEVTGPNTATLYGALLQAYTVGAAGTLTPISLCENVTLENLRLIGPSSVNDQKGIKLDRCGNSRVIDSTTTDFDHTHLHVERSVNCSIRGCRMSGTGVQEDLDYGILVLNGCYNCVVDGCTAESARHLVAIQGTSGVSRFIQVTNCHGIGLTDAGIFANAAVHEHDISHNTLDFSDVVDTTKDGITTAGGRPIITDNTIKSPGRHGVSWYPRINNFVGDYIAGTIRGIKAHGVSVAPGTTCCIDVATPGVAGAIAPLSFLTVDDIASSAFDVVVRATANLGSWIMDLSILNCRSMASHADGGVIVDAPSTSHIRRVVISKCKLSVGAGADACISVTGCATATIDHVVIDGNQGTNADYGLRLSYCDRVDTMGNDFGSYNTAPRIVSNTTNYTGSDIALAMQAGDVTQIATIAGGVVAVSNPIIRDLKVGGEGGAADDLDTINGGHHGQVLIVRGDGVNPITVKHSVGNIDCGADRTLSHIADTIVLFYNQAAANWYQLSFADNS